MEKTNYNSKEREEVIAGKQELLKTLEHHVKYLAEVNRTIKIIDEHLAEMTDYYYNEWIDDYNNFESSGNYTVLSQDHIYNAMQDIYEKKIKILKKIVSKLQ
ncbi:DUF4298 domain-containing protein [Porphyromonas pogonae]|uniref:DUF4298 domain-containing protein n=1 Tax=Porphyromonas pogonae TaxID=867595 RepID=UPI002E7964D1|nr:DUF4298 domain-containing protein [Porphyromonas pogonae]